MAEVSMNRVHFTLYTEMLDACTQGIYPTPSDVECGETNVTAMKEFVELYEELGKLLGEYRELLESDQQSLKDVGGAIRLQDIYLKQLYR